MTRADMIAAINEDFPRHSESRNNLLFMADRVVVALQNPGLPRRALIGDLLAAARQCGAHHPSAKRFLNEARALLVGGAK